MLNSSEQENNPEIIAYQMPIEWHLNNDQRIADDRMTRLPQNLKKVINQNSIVQGAITRNKSTGDIKVLLGDKDLSLFCLKLGLSYTMLTIAKKDRPSNTKVDSERELSISFSSGDGINKVLETNFDGPQIAQVQEIIFKRLAEIILAKMAEAK